MDNQSLKGRTLYIPQMNYAGSRALAAVFRSVGIDATVSPDSDPQTLELGGKYTSGDECYPEKVTLGDFLKLTEMEDFKPEETALFMATANGPCRFGQYSIYIQKVMRDLGYDDVMIFAPSSSNGYGAEGENATSLERTAWWAIVSSDILQKMLLKTRPYEINEGDTDEVFKKGVDKLCHAIEQQGATGKERMARIMEVLTTAREQFHQIPINYNPEFPLIGIVGEIFCRLNNFSNDNLIRRIEKFGAETWLSDITEWVWYTKVEHIRRLREARKRFSKDMLIAKIKNSFQKSDEHKLLKPFEEDFRGYEEPEVSELLDYNEPYLPCPPGAGGEMVLNIGRAIYLYEKGADGVVDISPFTCMNGIVSEALYPRVSRDHEGIPIRTFYFDGTQLDLDRDIGIFIELARNYKRKKSKKRKT